MSQQLTTTKNQFVMPIGTALTDTVTFCNLLAEAPYYKKMTPGGVFAIYLTAQELRLPVMACLNGGLHVIEGKVTISAQLMNHMIVQAGHFIEILHRGDDYCEIEFERSDRPGRTSKYRHKYTIDDARKAKLLGKDNWVKNPKSMLFARCLSEGGKIWMPDVFLGTYVTGEIEIQCEEIQDEEPKQHGHVTLTPQAQLIEQAKSSYEFLDEHMKYLDYVMSKSAWTIDQIKQWASNNPQDFERKYNKWCDELRTIELNQPPREDC